MDDIKIWHIKGVIYMYKQILLAVDGSENSLRATEHAVELAKLSGGKVDLINVIDFDEARSEMIQTRQSEVDESRRARYQPAVELLEENVLKNEVFVFYGNPGTVIVDHAKENDYDVILIGSRGLNKLQEMVLGSVSNRVVQKATCPVLVVK